MSGSIIPSILKIPDAMLFSLPMNAKYPRSVSFSSSHVGMLMAYSSGNLIIVLSGAKYIKAILRGHQHEICTLSFERKNLHIVSCDVEGFIMFWHYQDSIWQNTRTIQVKNPLTDISWCAARQLICYSNANGLFLGNVADFDQNSTKLAKKSVFCQFFEDGSRIASHSYSKSLIVFTLQTKKFIPQVFKYTVNVTQFEFHPTEPMFMVITSDGKLRIYYQEFNKIFTCSTILSVPIPGRFVRPPALFNFHSHSENYSKIVFLTKEAQKIKITIDRKGRIITENAQSVFYHLQNQPGIVAMGLRSAFKTNEGTEAITVKYNRISVYSNTKNSFLFHRSPVIQSSFAPFSDNFFTRDEEKTLIFWPFNNPYSTARKAATNVEYAIWLDKETIVLLRENAFSKLKITDFKEIKIDFPEISNCSAFFIQNDEIYAICGSKIITKTENFEIGNYILFDFSKSFKTNFLFVATTEDDQVNCFLFPSFSKLDVEKREGKIDKISVFSLNSFVILSNPYIEIWNYIDSKFEMTFKFEFGSMKGLFCDTNKIGGRIFTFDDKRVYLIENSIIPFLDMKDVTSVAVNFLGHFVAISQTSMCLFPCWNSKISDIIKKIEYSEITNRKDVTLNVGYMNEDSHFLLALASKISHNFMMSPMISIKPSNEMKKHVDTTFSHLLEFSSIGHYDELNPQQIPAIPGQYTTSSALNIKSKVTDEVKKLSEISLSFVNQDLDLFGLRYLTSVKSSSWPSPYIGLWLSFSTKQSTVSDILQSTITVNDLTKFFLPITIEEQKTLISLCRKALTNTWAATKKVDPVALIYIALGNTKQIQKLYELLGDTQRSDFFGKDFSQEKWRKSALKNAYSSLSRQNFLMAAALFLVANDITSCCQICVDKLNDPILAFLVLRLVENGINGSEMTKFLKSAKWSDPTIPIMISKLRKSDSISDMILPLLLETNINQNLSSMGDRRISLYQFYHRLTGDISPLKKICFNLMNDGLYPLAKYLILLPKNRQIQTSVSLDITEKIQSENSSGEKSENSENFDDVFQKVTKVEVESVSSDEDFDFGSKMVDDDFSDDYDDYDEEEKPKSEPKEEEIETKEEIPVKTNNFEIIDEFVQFQIDNLTKFFVEKPSTDTNDTSLYALQFGFRKIAFPLMNDANKELMKHHLANFIDFCGSMFIKSALVPASPSKILNLCEELSLYISGQKVTFDLDNILKMHADKYAYAIFFGAVCAACWSFEPQFLEQLLSFKVNKKVDSSNISESNSLFDADIGSPRFPDTIPSLVMSFLRDDFSHSTNIESARFVVMFLIYKKMLNLTSKFTTDEPFLRLLNDRFESLQKSLELYQIAQMAPSKLNPNCDRHFLQNIPLFDIVKDEFMLSTRHFNEAHERAKLKIPLPAIFRNSKLMLNNPYTIMSPFDQITSLCLNPHDSDVAAISDGSKIAVLHLSQLGTIIVEDKQNLAEVFYLVPHPVFNHFIAISSENVLLIDFSGNVTDIKIEVPSNDRISDASFSPYGDKLSIICGEKILFYVFDIAEIQLTPFISLDLNGKPTCVDWISEDIAVASIKGDLFVVNTVSGNSHLVEFNNDWGDISSMVYCKEKKSIVIGTVNGYCVVVDVGEVFSPSFVMSLGNPVISISGFQGVFCVICEGCRMSFFSTWNLGTVETLNTSFECNTASVMQSFVIGGGESKMISVWQAI
ncbi:hypothetical protein TVAG_076920 [Trichomonas vaginalis G3]|uniref:RAVE complex protein Rav1 C-terminal domain-containing protein n=1 Tax=Trichomonas vaginalis (strain ATCC PRA-98 / G3) TaxID=412133 RepID=A2D9T9_TRIV3|nr:vacuolar proton-transporting V-type ATPase complex assembly [Trichomonas vaginalis G3]EAY22945.1 hypothetical protein TVAG_076920 [Trichomonas vaginalis G3]KAI5527303.1 vacuolar proton-transporting V-type ATPase complex assembly [Trichomonas vaginalis G3]|eukprot:XP_001583931.1 hypothetical protein [Trichomonas vaginalis G3]